MIELAFIIAYAVLFVHVTFWEEHIFEEVGNWLDMKLPEWLQKPLYGCPICMSFWYGFIAMLILNPELNFWQRAATVFAAGGINVINVVFTTFLGKMKEEE
jgi:hypothetical protein